MEEEERIGAVERIQCIDPPGRVLEQRRVPRHRFGGRIRQVGQQAEAQVRVAIGEEADFEGLDELVDVAGAGDHRGNDHQGAR